MNKRNNNNNRRIEKCPGCSKAMTKVGKHGKWRCRNPRCAVVVVQVVGD